MTDPNEDEVKFNETLKRMLQTPPDPKRDDAKGKPKPKKEKPDD